VKESILKELKAHNADARSTPRPALIKSSLPVLTPSGMVWQTDPPQAFAKPVRVDSAELFAKASCSETPQSLAKACRTESQHHFQHNRGDQCYTDHQKSSVSEQWDPWGNDLWDDSNQTWANPNSAWAKAVCQESEESWGSVVRSDSKTAWAEGGGADPQRASANADHSDSKSNREAEAQAASQQTWVKSDTQRATPSVCRPEPQIIPPIRPPAADSAKRPAPVMPQLAAVAAKVPRVVPPAVAKKEMGVLPGVEAEFIGDTLWFANPLVWRDLHSVVADKKAKDEGAEDSNDATQGSTGQSAALQTLSAALGGKVTEDMAKSTQEALFAEASRLLFAVLGFSCEGNYSATLRSRAISFAATSVTWHELVPHAVLAQWFDFPTLLATFSGVPLRTAYEAARRPLRAQLLCALSRAAQLEIGRQASGLLRPQWARVLELFPELAQVCALRAHVRRRCWEDARDRSRSRSPVRKSEQPGGRGGGGAAAAAAAPQPPPNAVRFFVKGCGTLQDQHLAIHFQRFGDLLECALLRDKKKNTSRGMGFVTIEATGWYRGVKNTKEMVRDWVLNQADHMVLGNKLEVSLAESKPVEDEERSREDRVEERRRLREERAAAGAAPAGAESQQRLVISPWGKRWRQELADALPKEAEGPAPWTEPRLRALCRSLWAEAAEHVARTGGVEAQGALALFRGDVVSAGGTSEAEQPWCFVPAADLLLVVGEGIVGITAEGAFVATKRVDPVPPGPGDTWMPVAKTVPSLVAVAAAASGGGGGAAMPAAAATAMPPAGSNSWATMPLPPPSALPGGGGGGGGRRVFERGASEEEKIFVGGLTQGTTLEMLTTYFSQYGPITDAVVMSDKITGKPRGFGFCVFETVAVVDAVLDDYLKHRIDGKWVDVKRATPQPAPSPGGDGTGDTGMGAAGVAGPATEPQEDWTCPACSNHNFASHTACNRCLTPKGAAAAAAAAAGNTASPAPFSCYSSSSSSAPIYRGGGGGGGRGSGGGAGGSGLGGPGTGSGAVDGVSAGGPRTFTDATPAGHGLGRFDDASQRPRQFMEPAMPPHRWGPPWGGWSPPGRAWLPASWGAAPGGTWGPPGGAWSSGYDAVGYDPFRDG